jgi:lysozyme
MSRIINTAGLDLIKHFEGLRLEAYQDSGGIWTIGYGHTRGVHEGMTCSQHQADAWLEADLSIAEAEVLRVVKVPLNDNQFAALTSFAFNERGFALSTLVKKLNAGNYASVPDELKKWIYADHKIDPGLVKRRAAEAELFTKGS